LLQRAAITRASVNLLELRVRTPRDSIFGCRYAVGVDFRRFRTPSLPIFFTACSNARIASAILATALPSVCLSVRPSVTRRYSVKTTARSTAQFALSDSKRCLVLQKAKNIPQGRPLPLKSWLQVTYPLLIAWSLDAFCLVAPQG